MSDAAPFLHLTSGPTAGGAVRDALARLGREEEVISFRDALSEGPLGDIDAGAASRVAWWGHVRGMPLDHAAAEELDDTTVWTGVLRNPQRVVLWHGPQANERPLALQLETVRVEKTWKGRRYKIEGQANLGGLIRLPETLIVVSLRG